MKKQCHKVAIIVMIDDDRDESAKKCCSVKSEDGQAPVTVHQGALLSE